jgi:hypothetical protein
MALATVLLVAKKFATSALYYFQSVIINGDCSCNNRLVEPAPYASAFNHLHDESIPIVVGVLDLARRNTQRDD